MGVAVQQVEKHKKHSSWHILRQFEAIHPPSPGPHSSSGPNDWTHTAFRRRHCEFASEATIVDGKNLVRDNCGEYFVRHPQVIGSVDRVVEIDESARTKRKYHRGRQVSNQWDFGGIDRDSRDFVAVMVDHRDAATLLPIIHQYILPGTTMFSDQWAAYNGIANGPHSQKYVHLTVNQSQNFVDPVTRTHTHRASKTYGCA